MKKVFFSLPAIFVAVANLASPSMAFVASPVVSKSSSIFSTLATEIADVDVYDPATRDEMYGSNIASYLVDLHKREATFDFCGGMMFQLVLSDALKTHLTTVASNGGDTMPVLSDASKPRMSDVEGYEQTHTADNIVYFHGREVRSVPDAKGGFGFVLQLSLANGDDPEGWTKEEISEYSGATGGWASDRMRTWRKGDRLVSEGFGSFQSRFGPDAFALHHRFYLRLDGGNRMWLSAEDGCEGTPSAGRKKFMGMW